MPVSEADEQEKPAKVLWRRPKPPKKPKDNPLRPVKREVVVEDDFAYVDAMVDGLSRDFQLTATRDFGKLALPTPETSLSKENLSGLSEHGGFSREGYRRELSAIRDEICENEDRLATLRGAQDSMMGGRQLTEISQLVPLPSRAEQPTEFDLEYSNDKDDKWVLQGTESQTTLFGEPLGPRGPQAMTAARLTVQRQPPPVLEEEPERFIEKPEFTLGDFLADFRLSENTSDQTIQKAILSRDNYRKLTKLLFEKAESEKIKGPLKLNHIDMGDMAELQQPLVHVPERQLLLEMAGIVKAHIRAVEAVDVRPKFRRVAQPKGGAPVLQAEFTVQKYQDKPLNSKNTMQIAMAYEDALQFMSEPHHYQDVARSSEPFKLVAGEDQVSPTEFAFLDCLFSGGHWLSLKAHFISELPNMSLLKYSLTYLNLAFNHLSEIPQGVIDCENLQVLKLRNNPIREIAHDVSKLRKLRLLSLPFCLVSSISVSFWYSMSNLLSLDLSYNKLTILPDEMRYLKSLQDLNVAGNMLPSLPAGALHLNLKRLVLADNFVAPVFWRENSTNQPQRLADLASVVYVRTQETADTVPPALEELLSRSQARCAACQGPIFGTGLRIIRPCQEIFGVRHVPFTFYCCTPECHYVFRRGIADPLVFREETGKEENYVIVDPED